jgi:hypothetical protein
MEFAPSPTSKAPDIQNVRDEILKFLDEENAVEMPILLSRLGQHLSSKFDAPLRNLINEMKLSHFINKYLNGIASIEGDGTVSTVRLKMNESKQTNSNRYISAFWAAFWAWGRAIVARVHAGADADAAFGAGVWAGVWAGFGSVDRAGAGGAGAAGPAAGAGG